MNTKEEETKHNMRDESERMKKETPYVGPRGEFMTQKEEVMWMTRSQSQGGHFNNRASADKIPLAPDSQIVFTL